MNWPIVLPFEPDACGTVLLALVVAWVAFAAARCYPRVDLAGRLAGILVFVGTVFAGLAEANEPFLILATAITFAGLVSAATWTTLIVFAVIGNPR